MSRLAQRAELTVDGLPPDCQVIGAVVASEDVQWAGQAVRALIRAVASKFRPAFLVDLAPSATDLSSRFETPPENAGLAQVTFGEATLADVAVSDEDRSFAYISAGRTDRPWELTEARVLHVLAERVRGAGGVIVVVIEQGALRSVGRTEWCDGWVVLGGTGRGDGSPPSDEPELGRIQPSSPARSPSPATHRRTRRRGSSSSSSGRLLAVGLLLAAWMGIGTCFVQRMTSDDDSLPRLVRITAEQPARENAAGETDGTSGAAVETRRESSSAFDRASTPYSVLVASYGSRDVARKQIAQLRKNSEHLYFIAPTPVQGRLWYRVYAGSRPGRKSAEHLMHELVEVGVKEETRNWDLRPVPWTFRLETTGERSVAERRVANLRSREVPAYVLPVVTRGDTVYRVYSGAFETEESAEPLQEQLSEAGVAAKLVRRTYDEP